MSIRTIAPAFACLLLLATPASAAEPAPSSSWSSYLTPIVIGGALGALAMPYVYPVVAPTVGSALVTTGGAVQTAAPTVGLAVLDTASAAGAYAAGATSSASGYVLSQTMATQAAIGGAVGAVIGWLYAPR